MQTVMLFPRKPSADNQSGFRHGFKVEEILPLRAPQQYLMIPPKLIGFRVNMKILYPC